MDPPWRIDLLGRLQATRGNCVVSRFRTRKTALLLAYLALYPRRAHSRDALADLLWPDADPDAARTSLRVALSSLRHQLEPPGTPPGSVLATDPFLVQLSPSAFLTDVAEFEAALRAARTPGDAERALRLAEAVALYAGELLPGHYETWLLAERERLAEQYENALSQLAACRERPMPPPAPGSGSPASERVPQLPPEATPLVGRKREVDAARHLLLREEVRLLTLTGPAGIGKTRLGLRVAAGLSDTLPHGVFFVSLAPIFDAGLVLATITQMLGIRDTGGLSPRQSLEDYFREKQALLVLDNFEQVLAAAPLVAELLSAAPRLKILVTSRAVLRLQGEQEFPVPPLSVPDLNRLPPVSSLEQYAAVELFTRRAAKVQPGFTVSEEHAAAVAEICCRLDGLPLGIELAAVRVKLFPPQALLARLENRLQVLTRAARDVPERHQTLRGAIAWSYDLLEAGEKALFRRLSVFVGGFTVEAAEAVCGGEGVCGGLSPLGLDLLEGIASLVDQSLVQREPHAGGDARFTLLETLREYGQECLAQSGEGDAVRRQHAHFFMALAEEAEPELVREHQGAWLMRLEAERDNIRAAVAWGLECEPVTTLRLAAALWRFWLVQDCAAEGRKALERGLEQGTAAPVEVRAKALRAAARLTLGIRGLQGKDDGERARERLEEGLPLCRALEDESGIAFWLDLQGRLAMSRGDYAAARGFLEESIAISRTIGDQGCLAQSLRNRASAAWYECDYQAALRFREESLMISREMGDRYEVGVSLAGLGNLAYWLGEYQAARRWHEESLALQREIGARSSIAYTTYGLGDVALNQGDYEAARGYLEESLALYRDLGQKFWIAWGLDSLGELRRRQGEAAAARRSFEEMLAVARETEIDRLVGHALGRLGAAAWAQGETEAARSFYKASVARFRETHAAQRPEGLMHLPLRGLGDLACAAGDFVRARVFYEESLTLQRRIKDRKDMPDGLERLARVAEAEGDARRAARLLGAAAALRATMGARLPPVDRPEYECCMAAARAALGEEGFTAAWAQGQAMSLEDALEYALEAPG